VFDNIGDYRENDAHVIWCKQQKRTCRHVLA
jgi:hypothetical protein